MKRFIFAILAFVLLACTTACTDNAFSFEYNFDVVGHATGDLEMTYPGGSLGMKGSAELSFDYASAPATKSLSAYSPATVEELRASGKKNLGHVADVFLTDYYSAFTASSAEGTYYLHITGSVKEKLTGVEVKIDKVLTNEPVDK